MDAELRKMLEIMAAGGWSGPIYHDKRAQIESMAKAIDWTIQICWTCGGSVQLAARTILNNTPT